MYFFKCQKFVLNDLKKKKFPEIEDFAALGTYIVNYIRVLVPDDAYLTILGADFVVSYLAVVIEFFCNLRGRSS